MPRNPPDAEAPALLPPLLRKLPSLDLSSAGSCGGRGGGEELATAAGLPGSCRNTSPLPLVVGSGSDGLRDTTPGLSTTRPAPSLPTPSPCPGPGADSSTVSSSSSLAGGPRLPGDALVDICLAAAAVCGLCLSARLGLPGPAALPPRTARCPQSALGPRRPHSSAPKLCPRLQAHGFVQAQSGPLRRL